MNDSLDGLSRYWAAGFLERAHTAKETLIYSLQFGLSLSKPVIFRGMPFDRSGRTDLISVSQTDGESPLKTATLNDHTGRQGLAVIPLLQHS